jgi:hypothetical protein
MIERMIWNIHTAEAKSVSEWMVLEGEDISMSFWTFRKTSKVKKFKKG